MTGTGPTPSYEQALEASHALSLTTPPEFADINGHMNIRHYIATQDDAAAALFADLGFDEQYARSSQRYFFDLEHHLGYYAEVMIGAPISVHVRLLGRTHKVIHSIAFIVNHQTRKLANTMEAMTAHVDLATRRTVPFRSKDVRRLDDLILAHQSLAWPAPVCGVMRLPAHALVVPMAEGSAAVET